MLKRLMMVLVGWIAAMGIAMAAPVEVNTADQAALDGVKGIGPTTSKTILEERKKGGNFKDWADLEKRVKGIGDKRAASLSQAGLTVNGQSKPGNAAEKDTKEQTKKADAPKAADAAAPAAAKSEPAKAKNEPAPKK